MKFGIAIQNLRTDAEYGYNAQTVFETGSAIKSPIGMLAVHKSIEQSVGLSEYTFTLTRDHLSNGSGLLKNTASDLGQYLVKDMRAHDGSAVITLGNLIRLNIVNSDCTATNALIDFLDGRDAVNKGMQTTLGVEGIELVTEALNFPGVDHNQVPYQVGAATPTALMQYHRTRVIRALVHAEGPEHPYSWFGGLHDEVARHWLFDEDLYPPMKPHSWNHKTGSVIDQRHGQFYAAAADAGVLFRGDSSFVIGAAAVEPQRPSSEDGRDADSFESAFEIAALKALSRFNVPIFDEDAAAA